jgi:hypothetical protein
VLKSAASIPSQKLNDIEKAVETSTAVKQEMSREIDELRKFKKESLKFYDKKIHEIKGLSSKLSKYQPEEQLRSITEKLTLSESTSRLIRQAMTRGGK